MKSGVTLQQMLTEVKRQSESKEDYLIAPNRLRMESYGKEMFLHLSDDSGTELIEPMTITGIAHRQIGTHLRIPAAYYDRMREERPDLLAYNANTWFKQESSQRMLRTLDGSARAYLSNRYRRIDNIDIAGVTLPILGGLPDIRFESCQITESRTRSGAGRGAALRGQYCGDPLLLSALSALRALRDLHGLAVQLHGIPCAALFAAHRADLAVDLNGPALDQLLRLAARLAQTGELQKSVKLNKVGVNTNFFHTLSFYLIGASVGAGHVRPSTLLQQPLTGRLFLSAGPGMPGPYNSALVLEPYRQHQIDKVLAVLG